MLETTDSGLIFLQTLERNVGSPVALSGGMAANEIMMLALDEVVPDPEQPRRHFEREAMERLKEAMIAVGQLQPIRVRKVDGRWMIVDGQRRWLALSALAKQYADDERFRIIRAYVGGEQDDDEASRRVVQVLSNIGEDLTPTEKAEALAEVRAAEPDLTPAEFAGRFGVPEGQVKFLIQLASAPSFIRAFGAGSEALPLWNLVTLLRLHRKLRRYDDVQFRETEGAHERVADREVRRLGERARTEGWGKRRLQTEADRTVGRVTGNTERGGRDSLASIRKCLDKLEGLSNQERQELRELLRATLHRLSGIPPRRGRPSVPPTVRG